VVELDLGQLEPPAPLGLVPQTILQRTSCVLLSDEELYRFRVVKLRERIQTHRVDRIRLPVAKQPSQRLNPILLSTAPLHARALGLRRDEDRPIGPLPVSLP
jgi:hypothetical protein